MRYAFRIRRPTASGRQASGLIFVGAVVVALVLGNLTGIILSIGMAVVGGYFLLRPPSPNLYVETTPNELVVHILLTNRISLQDIRAIELWRPDYSPFMRGVANFFLVFGNLFGGGHELMKADDPPRDVMVRFRKWVWVFIVLPPFVLPRRNWSLWVEDAESLKDDLEGRLRAFVG